MVGVIAWMCSVPTIGGGIVAFCIGIAIAVGIAKD